MLDDPRFMVNDLNQHGIKRWKLWPISDRTHWSYRL